MPDGGAIGLFYGGVLTGVCMKTFGANPFSYPCGTAAFPHRNICTCCASGINGSGSNDREDYAHLCCVMPESSRHDPEPAR